MTLLGEVVQELERSDVAACVIGAAAMAVSGVSRSTRDIDLFSTDAAVLAPAFWGRLTAAGALADIRLGDASDPLRGVVRISRSGERPIDVVVGKHPWQEAIPSRAIPSDIEGTRLGVATAADVILLKLHAGGPQDAWDIAALLAAADRGTLVAEVDGKVAELPRDARELWQKIRA